MTPEELAKLFHETYERLAPNFGYETRKETAVAWDDIPADSPNKRLMIAVCGEILMGKGIIDFSKINSVTANNTLSAAAYIPPGAQVNLKF